MGFAPLPTKEVRVIHFEGKFEYIEWRVKFYTVGITPIPPDLLEEGKNHCCLILRHLPQEWYHGYAFAILHHTLEGNYLTVCNWKNGNECETKIFKRGSDHWYGIQTSGQMTLCTGHGRIIGHEVELWDLYVTKNAGGIKAYWEEYYGKQEAAAEYQCT